MREEKRWFTLANDRVSGPFDPSEIEGDGSSLLIWGRGQPEWMTLEKWKAYWADQEARSVQSKQPERLWRVRMLDQEYPAMPYDRMIHLLKAQDSVETVKIWTEGYSEWREIYQIHKVMDELGVSRRSHPRVPIAGQVMCEGTTGSFVSRALSISEGGLGMIETPSIKIGERFKIVLKSPNLYTPMHATAEVVYVGADGYCGLKFIGIQTESRSAIIEYVKKFLESRPSGSGAAV